MVERGDGGACTGAGSRGAPAAKPVNFLRMYFEG